MISSLITSVRPKLSFAAETETETEFRLLSEFRPKPKPKPNLFFKSILLNIILIYCTHIILILLGNIVIYLK